MKFKITLLFLLIAFNLPGYSQKPSALQLNYISSFDNVNHPQVAYWFFSKDMLNPVRYKGKIDSLAKNSKFTLIFLTSRNGVNFYDVPKMLPIFKDVVSYAHERGLKIGLQIWDNKAPVDIENTERLIQEGEVTLNEKGNATYSTEAKHVRDKNSLIKSELFKIYVFKKVAEGFYDPATLRDITDQCKSTDRKETVSLTINGGKGLNGYTAYILTQHYYNFSSNHSTNAVERLTSALKGYRVVPFDGVGLDEFTNLRVATTSELKKANETFRERSYSLAMASEFKSKTGMDLDRVLFDMRYAPLNNDIVRIKAINAYMSIMREGTMHLERAIYQYGKEYFGKDTFIGLHDTHHNFLDGDEIWQTGLNWWNVVRDYGQSDEGSPTATQTGIGMAYKMNVMYNMYYNKSLDNIVDKSLTDLRYGIRTHYHAINDIQGWGVSVERPEALQQINKVENAARLLNHFNPPFPQTKLLVIFGMEALSDWYPDEKQRGLSDINDQLFIEQKAKEIWDEGYHNALVPTDVVNDGRLTIDKDGKPIMQGHKFDAVVFLYPQYAKEATLKFLESYLQKGGKLMVEGAATRGFLGDDIAARWKAISNKATVKGFSVSDISKLGIIKNSLPDGSVNEDGSYVFTNIKALTDGQPAEFSFVKNAVAYTGNYTELAAIKTDDNGNVVKFAATGFLSLKKNGVVIFSLSQPADVFMEKTGNIIKLTIAGDTRTAKVAVNKL